MIKEVRDQCSSHVASDYRESQQLRQGSSSEPLHKASQIDRPWYYYRAVQRGNIINRLTALNGDRWKKAKEYGPSEVGTLMLRRGCAGTLWSHKQVYHCIHRRKILLLLNYIVCNFRLPCFLRTSSEITHPRRQYAMSPKTISAEAILKPDSSPAIVDKEDVQANGLGFFQRDMREIDRRQVIQICWILRGRTEGTLNNPTQML